MIERWEQTSGGDKQMALRVDFTIILRTVRRTPPKEWGFKRKTGFYVVWNLGWPD